MGKANPGLLSASLRCLIASCLQTNYYNLQPLFFLVERILHCLKDLEFFILYSAA